MTKRISPELACEFKSRLASKDVSIKEFCALYGFNYQSFIQALNGFRDAKPKFMKAIYDYV